MQQIVPAEDHDTSLDIYEWDEQGDTVKLHLDRQRQRQLRRMQHRTTPASAPPNRWTPNAVRRAASGSSRPKTPSSSLPGIDSRLATENGAVFFYSPESLDPSKPGVPNERNLYLYRNGQVHLVATLDPGTKINRIQISPRRPACAPSSPRRA